MNKENILAKNTAARAIVHALLEDYAKTVSKIEKVTEKEVKTRVLKAAQKLTQSQEYLKDLE